MLLIQLMIIIWYYAVSTSFAKVMAIMYLVLQDDLATVMTDYRCRFTEEVSAKYQSYIKAATHRSGRCWTQAWILTC